MKIYLDDLRPCPKGWVLAKSAEDAIALLQEYPVEEISLDHDLGDTDHTPEWTGYTVLEWIEEKVLSEEYPLPKIRIHTANPAARKKMELALAALQEKEEKLK